MTSSGWPVTIRVVDRSNGHVKDENEDDDEDDGNDDDDDKGVGRHLTITINIPNGVLNKKAFIVLPHSTRVALGLVGDAPGTHISARFKLKRRDDVAQVAFIGSLENRHLLMLCEPQVRAQEKTAPVQWTNKYPSDVVGELLTFFRRGLEVAALSAIVGSRWATWSSSDPLSKAAAGLPRNAYCQGVALNAGQFRLAGARQDNQEGKKQKGLIVALVDRTGKRID